MNIADIYKSKASQTFLDKINFFNSPNRKGIGVTIYPDRKYLLKFYLEIREADNLQECSSLLKQEFYKFNAFKKFADFSKPSSYAIGKKISSDLAEYDYYHVKFKRRMHFNKCHFKLNLLDLDKCSFGFSKEFNDKRVLRKRYFYAHDTGNKALINSIFNLNTDIHNINHFEIYSNSTDNYKINYIYKKSNYDAFKSDQIDNINALFNKTPVYYGINNNNEVSVYYSFSTQ